MNIRGMQYLAFDWALRCFGREHVFDDKVRALRCVEEVIELCQAVGVGQHDISRVMVKVYERPKGLMDQEVGGIMMTLMVFCERNGIDIEYQAFNELRRVLGVDSEHFARRNEEKVKPSAA